MGLGRVLSMKNILYTVGGMIIAPKIIGISPQLGAAAGGLLGAGPIGAIIGYFGAPMISKIGLPGGNSVQMYG